MGLGALPTLTVNDAKAILRDCPAVAAVTYGKRQVAQVLLEAVVLSTIGGILGVLCGVVGAKLVSILAGWTTLVSADAIVLALLFSSAVGIFFGWSPAWKAAHLDPIQVLRYE